MRSQLVHIHDHYNYGSFSQTSVFKDSKKKVRKREYFKDAEAQSMGMGFFHSEVQASSDHDEIEVVAQRACDEMFKKAKAKVDGAAGTFQLVVTAVLVIGYSAENTVCSGACKPALADLAKRAEAAFVTRYATQKGRAPARLKVRRSKSFNVSAQVGAGHKYKGLEKGANVDRGSPSLNHHQVSEYKAFK